VSTPNAPAPIASVSEAERAIANLNKIMDRLVDTVTEETERVRAGRLRDAVELDETKVELARLYAAETERVKSAKDIIAQSLPDALDRLRKRHDAFRALLQNALTVQTTLIGQKQNEEMRTLTEASLAQNEEVKKISAWAAILFAPTPVGTVYGMNFDRMPELHWFYGYPAALALMVVTSTTLYVIFKRRHWL